MPKIEKVFVFVAEDESEGDEGVVAAKFDNLLMPFVASSEYKVGKLLPHAQMIANTTGKKISVYLFSGPRSLVRVIEKEE